LKTLSKSAELVLLNTLFKTRDPKHAEKVNEEFKGQLSTYRFDKLDATDLKQILDEGPKDLPLKSFSQMSDSDNFWFLFIFSS
jgi:hypothetical protein